MNGSSPLARGTHIHLGLRSPIDRLIPARAGNTASISERVSEIAAHPRSRGEHGHSISGDCLVLGSSPLARGTPHLAFSRTLRERLIPARAGNTLRPLGCLVGIAAHPRSRGEHKGSDLGPGGAAGSSPLARGTQSLLRESTGPPRLIPARAGNTDERYRYVGIFSAHPRSRGEHFISLFLGHVLAGSSPLARGTQQQRNQCPTTTRLIPARAGNTGPSRSCADGCPAHPRSRGEHLL